MELVALQVQPLYNPNMATLILFSTMTLGFPPLLLYLQKKTTIIKKLNPIILCYLLGLLLGNTGLMTEAGLNLMDNLASVSATLAIPLMLFTLDLKKGKRLAGKAGLSLVFASISVFIVSFLAHLVFKQRIPNSAELSGLTLGVYTGGTPNLAAIRTALNMDLSSYLAVHTADMLWSALYLLFILGLGKKLIVPLLPQSQAIQEELAEESNWVEKQQWDKGALNKGKFLPLLRNFGMALLCVAAGVGLSMAVPEGISTLVAILGITTFALGLSFIKPIRETQYSFQLGEYFIYVFCVAAGALGDIGELLSSAPSVILFVGFVLFGSFLLHLLLCRIGGVDGKTMLITSTSAICSPPFVPVTALNLECPNLIVPGITTGLIGYALGNYLGVIAARLFALI